MSQRLLIQAEGGAPVELPRSGVLSIGSSADADLLVEGVGVAAVHCVIGRIKGGGWALKDLGSPAGTKVNGAAVQQARLAAGDEIALGSKRLAVFDPAAKAAPNSRPKAKAAAVSPAAAEFNSVPELKGYRIEKRLGRGGMGAVFLAVQESLDRKVALKVLNPKLSADADFVARFQAEAKAAAALSHPNVVTVHDVWEEGGHHWVSMEFMERGDLEERIGRAGKLDPAEVIAVLIEASKGLVFAELRGIVHRDIKPANLMQDGLGLTKIADLGLATQLEAEAAVGETRIFGTPHFISPEQARGEPVDGRSDLYSLGATAYRLLTGHTPFEGQSTRDILRGHFTEAPRPPREHAPQVSEGLERVVLRLLEKDPAERYQKAGDLLEDLERLRTGQAVGGDGGGSKLGLVAGLVGLAAVAGGAWFFLGQGADGSGGPGAKGSGGPSGGGASAQRSDPEGTAGEGLGQLAEGDLDEPDFGGELDPVSDDDSALKALEREAQNAYAELAKDLLPDERLAALRELVGAFAGTTEATRWEGEIASISGQLAAESSQQQQLMGTAKTVLEALASATRSSDRPLHEMLGALSAVKVPPELERTTSFQAERTQLLTAVFDQRLSDAKAELAAIDALADQGQFEAVAARLNGLLASTAPTPPSAADPASTAPGSPQAIERQAAGLPPVPELEALVSLNAELDLRLYQLDYERRVWGIEREHRDAATLAGALSREGELADPLAELDLNAVEAELKRLSEGLGATDSAAFCAELRSDLARAAAVLEAISGAFGKGEWRRKSILDPRARSQKTSTVVGADKRGLMIDGDDGPEVLPWSAFRANPTAFEQLFRQRLSRGFNPEEQRGIAALMRITAVQRAVDEAVEMLQTGRAMLTPGEVEAMLAGFETARTWTELIEGETTREAQRLEAEFAAAALLADSLSATGEGAWASASADGERLLEQRRDTLLVRLISDGRPWIPAPEAPEPPAPAQPAGLGSGADATTQRSEGSGESPNPSPEDGGEDGGGEEPGSDGSD